MAGLPGAISSVPNGMASAALIGVNPIGGLAAEAPTVVLRLRGRTAVGATFVKVVDDYATALDAVRGRLYLSGVDSTVAELLRRTDRLDVSDPITIFEATELVGESTGQALREAEAWAVRHRPR